MVSLTSPRFSSFLGIIVLLIYILANISIPGILNYEIQLIFLLLISLFIALAGYNFAANEMKDTAGVQSSLELGIVKMLAIILFTIFLVIGYNAFVLIIVQMFNASSLDETSEIAAGFVLISILYITIYPFFQTINLARSGEQSSIPSEFVIEKFVEFLSEKLKSPILAGTLLYSLFYILPIVLITISTGGNFLVAIFLWSLLLPLISVSALAGAGFGEDLIRLRLIRNPIKDLKKLGLPKINIKKLKFETGGLLLVLFAIQAIITTTIFGVRSVFLGFEIGAAEAGIGIGTLFLTLFNKGRGASKELSQVWKETGFKVSTYQLFLPIFVFFGVVLSSILEVFISNSVGILADDSLGLTDYIPVISIFLAVQNLFLVFTALYIYKTVPGTAERRLIKEIPNFYKNDDGTPNIKGYLFIYKKLKSDRSVENLLQLISKMIIKDLSQVDLLKDLLNESLTNGNERVQTAASETLYLIIQKVNYVDKDLLLLARKSIKSEYPGTRIYAVRSYRELIKLYKDIEKEELLTEIIEYLNDDDSVVAWDTGIILQKVINEDEKYRNYILALVVKVLINTEKENAIKSVTRLLTKLAYDSHKIGQMVISVLGSKLAMHDVENMDNLVIGVRAVLRGNPQLAHDLIDQVSTGTSDPDMNYRKRSYIVLLNLAEYSEGIDDEILKLILKGISDKSEEIQELAYISLRKEVINSPDFTIEIFTIISSLFLELRGIALLGALDVLEAIAITNKDISKEIYDLVYNAARSSNDAVRSKILKIFSLLVENEQSINMEVYNICDKNLDHQNDEVRKQAIHAMGKAVVSSPSLSKVVYRKINASRNDSSFIVQLASVEAMGHVASADRSYSDEIFNSLTPLLDDENWRVRLAAFNGLFAASKKRKDLLGDLVSQTLVALYDSDPIVREGAFDAINWLIPNYRASSELIVKYIASSLKKIDDDVLPTIYNSLEVIAERKVSLVDSIIPILPRGFSSEDASTRNNCLSALSTVMKKLSNSREPSKDVHKGLNKLMTELLKNANNSHTGIRKTAYEGITQITKSVPHFKVARRGRKSLKIAKKHEKDVALIDQLNKAIIVTTPPLDMY